MESVKKGKTLMCANPHSIEVATRDPLFAAALKIADVLLPDGVGIVYASMILGGQIRERITGSDIFCALSERLNEDSSCSYFFLGSTEATLSAIKQKMAKEYPKIRFVGCYSPPFKDIFSEIDNQAIIDAVNRSRADVLWVGMTAPKQEKWIYQHKDRLDVKFIGAIGAVFDFYAGTVTRSNPWLQDHGLEWLLRLLREPRRLWYRNFVSNPKFLIRVLLHRIKRGSWGRAHGDVHK